jgi:hypothetical protein
MPALKNQRHELFCRNLIEGAQRGWSATDAYLKAGYKGEEGVARACASRLLTNENIKRRLEELNAPAVRKTEITVEALLNKLEANIAGAEAKGQHGAVNGSIGLMAQLRGLLINRTEIGSAGEFDQCRTTEEVIETLLAHHESPAAALAELDELRSMVEAYAANHATLMPTAAPARPAPGGEARLSLQYLQPRRRRR